MSENTTPEKTADGGLSSTALLGFLKLKRSGDVVSIKDLRAARTITEKGGSWKKHHYLMLNYSDGEQLRLCYGTDLDPADYNEKRRDEDFMQIEEALLSLPNDQSPSVDAKEKPMP
jgi:hypothetical protein